MMIKVTDILLILTSLASGIFGAALYDKLMGQEHQKIYALDLNSVLLSIDVNDPERKQKLLQHTKVLQEKASDLAEAGAIVIDGSLVIDAPRNIFIGVQNEK